MNEYAWKGSVFSNGLNFKPALLKRHEICHLDEWWDCQVFERKHISFALWALFWGYTLIAFATRVTSHPSHNDKVCHLCSAGTIEAWNYHPRSMHLNLCTTLHGAAHLLTVWCIFCSSPIWKLSQYVSLQGSRLVETREDEIITEFCPVGFIKTFCIVSGNK